MELNAEEIVGTIKKAHREGSQPSEEWLLGATAYMAENLAEFSAFSAELLYPLACLLSRPYSAAAKENICRILGRANRSESRETIFQVWVNQRAPELEALLRRKNWPLEITEPEYRTIYALKFNRLDWLSRNTAQIRRVIVACEDSDEEISARAVRWLERLNTREVMELVAVRWSSSPQPVYLDLLAKNRHFAKSADLIIPIALKGGQLELIANQGDAVARMFDRLALEKSSRLAEALQESLQNLESLAAQQILCKWAVDYEIPVVQRAAVAGGYAPQELNERVLFYFLTEQWEKYETLDFDYRLLQNIYKSVSVKQRNRIASLIRKSGRVDYLRIMPHDRAVLRSASNTVYEGQVVVSVLEHNQKWPELWEQVFKLPIIWSIFAVRILAKNGWMPDNIEEQKVFHRLKDLVRGEIITSHEQLGQLSFAARPLAEVTVNQHTEVVQLLASGYNFSAVVRRTLLYIEAALRYSYRYAIELDFLPQVQAAEFDIEIEADNGSFEQKNQDNQNERVVCRTSQL